MITWPKTQLSNCFGGTSIRGPIKLLHSHWYLISLHMWALSQEESLPHGGLWECYKWVQGVVWTGFCPTGPHKLWHKLVCNIFNWHQWFRMTSVILMGAKQLLGFLKVLRIAPAKASFGFVGPWDGGGYRQGQRNSSDRRDLEDRHHCL